MSNNINTGQQQAVEGIARIVRVDGGLALLEPEQTGGCGGCASASVCNEKGIGTLASRLEARRFSMPNHLALATGDRVVLAIRPHSLVTASAVAYLLPLFSALFCAALAQWRYGNDLSSLAGMLFGLLGGFVLTRLAARCMAKNEKNEFQIIRLANASEHCR